MKEIEKMLSKKKEQIDKLEVPEELEIRLRSALQNRCVHPSSKRGWKVKAVVILIALSLAGYHFDTLAFYGKKLMGYDPLMSTTLKELNEEGKGQTIDKSYTFKNGVTLTLDGMMLDDNQLLAFYTVKTPEGNGDTVDIEPVRIIKGTSDEYFMRSSCGELNEQKTEIKYITVFDPPRLHEKSFKFSFALRQGENREEGEITFTLNPNKAMGHTLKKRLNKTIKVEGTKIRFKSILASPTVTVIKGSVQNIFKLAKDQILKERIRPKHLEVRLLANGKELPWQGGGMSTDMKGITFDKEYDALPNDLEQLQIQVGSFSADHDVHKQIELQKNGKSQSISILKQNINIDKVYEYKGDTYIMITTEESVILTRVYLIMDGKKVELQETIDDVYDKKIDGMIMHTRTLHFPGMGRELQLDIQRMTYEKPCNQVIDIPIN